MLEFSKYLDFVKDLFFPLEIKKKSVIQRINTHLKIVVLNEIIKDQASRQAVAFIPVLVPTVVRFQNYKYITRQSASLLLFE